MRYDPSRLRIMDEDDFLETVEWMNTEISSFIENSLYITGEVPDLDDFIERYPQYDHEILYPQITKEMARITDLVQKELEQ